VKKKQYLIQKVATGHSVLFNIKSQKNKDKYFCFYKTNMNNEYNKSKLIFQKNYNKLLETIHINKIKIGIILHMDLITYIMDNDDYDDYCNDLKIFIFI